MTPELSFIMFESSMLSRVFVETVRRGYNSKEFVRILMTDDYGVNIMNGVCHSEWSDSLFLLSGFETFVGLPKGEVYDEFFMEFIGYLYKYWVETRKADPRDVYEIAPPETILQSFEFLHTQGWDYVIDYLLELYKEVNYD